LLNGLVVSLKQNSIHNSVLKRDVHNHVIAVLFETGRYHSSLQSVYENLGYKRSDYVDKSVDIYDRDPSSFVTNVVRGVRIPRDVNSAWKSC